MRKFNKLIFFGNPSCAKKLEELHERIEDGASIMSGMQQSPHCTSEQDAKDEQEYREKMQIELEDCIRDISVALTGKHIEFIDTSADCGPVMITVEEIEYLKTVSENHKLKEKCNLFRLELAENRTVISALVEKIESLESQQKSV
jgi:hypothetical protein